MYPYTRHHHHQSSNSEPPAGGHPHAGPPTGALSPRSLVDLTGWQSRDDLNRFDSPAVQHQLVSSTGENPNVGSDGPAPSPVHSDAPLPLTYPIGPAGHMGTPGAAPYEPQPFSFGGPPLYTSPPAAFSSGDKTVPCYPALVFWNGPAFYPAASDVAAAAFWDVSYPHTFTTASRFWDRPSPRGDQFTSGSPSEVEQPAERADALSYNWMSSHLGKISLPLSLSPVKGPRAGSPGSRVHYNTEHKAPSK